MRGSTTRFCGALLVVLTTATGVPAAVAAAGSGVDGGTYTSPTHGHRFSWDTESWQVNSEEVDRNGWDILRLQYGETGYLYVEGYPGYDGDPTDCLAGTYEDKFADLPDVAPATRDGEPFAGSEDGAAYAAYTYMGQQRDQEIERAAFVNCHTLIPGESVVAFTLVSTREAFFDDLEATLVVIDSLELSNHDEDPEPDVTGSDEDVYESPHYGYTLTYDSFRWSVTEDDDPDDPYDVVVFSNGASVVALTGDPDYDDDEAADCLADYVDPFQDRADVSAVEPWDDRGAEGEEDDRAWTTFGYVDEDLGDRVRYYECRWLGDGVMLVIVQAADPDSYEFEIEERQMLLEELVPAGAAPDRRPPRHQPETSPDD